MRENEEVFMHLLSEGVFSIDGEGRIWRHKLYFECFRGNTPIERILDTPKRAELIATMKYYFVPYYYYKKDYQIFAHRAVFIHVNKREIPEGMVINHIDGNKINNHPNNLEMVTQQENLLHASKVLNVMSRPGLRAEKNGQTKLKTSEVIEIRRQWSTRSMTQKDMAQKYGVSVPTIQGICVRKTWAHIS